MRLTKTMAAVGFQVSASVFLGLSAYGIFCYLDPSNPVILPPSLSLLLAGGIAASIAGVCFFGIRWDRRKAEEAARAAPKSAKDGKKKEH